MTMIKSQGQGSYYGGHRSRSKTWRCFHSLISSCYRLFLNQETASFSQIVHFGRVSQTVFFEKINPLYHHNFDINVSMFMSNLLLLLHVFETLYDYIICKEGFLVKSMSQYKDMGIYTCNYQIDYSG